MAESTNSSSHLPSIDINDEDDEDDNTKEDTILTKKKPLKQQQVFNDDHTHSLFGGQVSITVNEINFDT